MPYAYVRPLASIEPLAIRVGLPVNITWGMTDIEPLATQRLASPSGTQVVAWERHWGESLAKHLLSRLGGDPDDVPRWDDGDYDSLFVIRTTESENGTRRTTFRQEQEGLNSMSETCK